MGRWFDFSVFSIKKPTCLSAFLMFGERIFPAQYQFLDGSPLAGRVMASTQLPFRG
jgi:hypothetical protein